MITEPAFSAGLILATRARAVLTSWAVTNACGLGAGTADLSDDVLGLVEMARDFVVGRATGVGSRGGAVGADVVADADVATDARGEVNLTDGADSGALPAVAPGRKVGVALDWSACGDCVVLLVGLDPLSGGAPQAGSVTAASATSSTDRRRRGTRYVYRSSQPT